MPFHYARQILRCRRRGISSRFWVCKEENNARDKGGTRKNQFQGI